MIMDFGILKLKSTVVRIVSRRDHEGFGQCESEMPKQYERLAPY